MIEWRINKLNFADHPSIASKYTKFLATNSGHNLVKDLVTSISFLTSDVSTLKTQLADAKRWADSATDTVDKLLPPMIPHSGQLLLLLNPQKLI